MSQKGSGMSDMREQDRASGTITEACDRVEMWFDRPASAWAFSIDDLRTVIEAARERDQALLDRTEFEVEADTARAERDALAVQIEAAKSEIDYLARNTDLDLMGGVIGRILSADPASFVREANREEVRATAMSIRMTAEGREVYAQRLTDAILAEYRVVKR